MIKVLTDPHEIGIIVNHHKIMEECREDGDTEIITEFDFNHWAYIGVYKTELIGLAEVRLDGLSVAEAHFKMLPEHRRAAHKHAKQIISFLFEKLPINKVHAIVPVIYPHVIRFGIACGMQREGLIRQSFLKNGHYYDQVLLGITRYEQIKQSR